MLCTWKRVPPGLRRWGIPGPPVRGQSAERARTTTLRKAAAVHFIVAGPRALRGLTSPSGPGMVGATALSVFPVRQAAEMQVAWDSVSPTQWLDAWVSGTMQGSAAVSKKKGPAWAGTTALTVRVGPSLEQKATCPAWAGAVVLTVRVGTALEQRTRTRGALPRAREKGTELSACTEIGASVPEDAVAQSFARSKRLP